MLEKSLTSLLLLLAGVWWTLAIVAWMLLQRHFESPARRAERLGPGVEKASRLSRLLDTVEFALPGVLPIGLALDGLGFGGVVMYAPGWSFFLPHAELLQLLGGLLLLVGLPLLTSGAFLTAKYVYSRASEERTLMDHGPYRYIRHPIYLSFVLIGPGLLLLSLNLAMLPMLFTLSALTYPKGEERELVERYADAYRAYQRRTGRFLPRRRRGP